MSVVIALAIVVLVLLLIFIVERGAAESDEPVAAAAVAPRRSADGFAGPPGTGSPWRETHAAVDTDSCAVSSGSHDDEAARAERQRDDALRSILVALEARPEPRARAAGLYFRAARGRVDSRTAVPCRAPGDACAAIEQRQREDRDSAEALARLAVESPDPQVYAWAYRSCAALPRDAAASCQLVNAPQWARLDPANAEPWLAVAREARSRRDAAALDDAMFHVAAASLHDAGWGRVAAQMIDAAPPDDRLIVGTWLASLDAIGYETLDLALPDMTRYCDARAVANANRRDTCEKIATLLIDRSTTLIGRDVGIGLGKKLDWPAERLAVVEQERDAAYAVDLRDAAPPGEPLSCSNVRRDLARLAEVGRLGEVEAMRRRIAATGEPLASVAAEGRRAARVTEEAEAAASAASAAVAPSPYSSGPLPAR